MARKRASEDIWATIGGDCLDITALICIITAPKLYTCQVPVREPAGWAFQPALTAGETVLHLSDRL